MQYIFITLRVLALRKQRVRRNKLLPKWLASFEIDICHLCIEIPGSKKIF